MNYTGKDIIEAAKLGHVRLVRKILDADELLVNAQEECTGMTCLHYAAFGSDFNLADTLFEVDQIKPRVFDDLGRTPLDMAHITKNKDMIVYMRERCLPPEFSSEIPDNDDDGFDLKPKAPSL